MTPALSLDPSLDLSLFPAYDSLISSLRSLWAPPAHLPLSEWAEQNIVLSSEYAARASRLRLFGWQRAMFDSITDPSVEEVVFFVSTQMVKTIALQCAIAYAVCEDPGPILLVEPKEEDGKAFERERLAPMIRDCECLRGKIGGKSDGNLILSKQFPGGSLSIVSGRIPGELARRSIRYLYADEIDKLPATVGTAGRKEGDPLDMARERQVTFGSRKKRILCCSPTVKGLSRIGKSYASSDMRKPWLPCPACGQYQLLDFFAGVKWDNSLPVELRPPTAHYECVHCHAHWNDVQRWNACNHIDWRAERPFVGIAGFWINHLYSPWKRLSEIVKHYLAAKDDRQLYQVFWNTVLAKEWVDEGQTPDHQALYDRRDTYLHGDHAHAVIPARGLFLTAAVDVQDSPPRLVVETIAWGRGLESWSLDYREITVSVDGQPLPVTHKSLWDELDRQILSRAWPHELGRSLSIWVMCIDTGNRPKPVYEFARRHPQASYDPGTGLRVRSLRTVVPIKGTPDPLKIISSISKEDAARKRQGVRIVGIGTHCVKQQIYDQLQHVQPRPDTTLSGSPAPGCYHHPQYDMQYFLGLTAEVRVVKDDGKVVWENRGGRNEPFDCKVYNRAGATIVGGDRFNESQWRQLEAAVGVVVEDVKPTVPVPVVAVDPPAGQPLGQPLGQPVRPSVPVSGLTPAARPFTNPTRGTVRGSFL